jgi:predicted phage baseplate assembly protein
MSRPPRPHPARSTGGTRTDAQDRLDYLPLEYADFLELERRLAVHALGRGTDQGADVADTFFQLSSLVGHVLAVYQRQYAREAYLSTAQAASSLVRHAHRLGSEPDPGLAASGYAVLFTKPGVRGTVAAGQPLASVPVGQEKAQDYETGDDVAVDAVLNELVPVQSVQPQVVAGGATEIVLDGVGHGLATGDEAALIAGIARDWVGTVVREVVELPDGRGRTVVRVADELPAFTADDPTAVVPVLLARPAVTTHSFGHDADPLLYPPARVRDATDDDGTTTTRGARFGVLQPHRPQASTVSTKWWYTASRTDGGAYRDDDVYLSEQLKQPTIDDWVVRWTGVGREVFRVIGEGVAAVVLNRSEQVEVTPQKVTVTPTDDGGWTTTVSAGTNKQFTTQTGHLAGTVTAVRLIDAEDHLLLRSESPVESTWSAAWQVRALLSTAVPNPGALVQPLLLHGLLTTLAPGRPVVFRDPVSGAAQVVRLRRVELDETQGVTSVEWDPLTPDPDRPWTLDRLVVHANVAPVSHGRTVHETLLASDGVTPFQARSLREAPLTYLPGVSGAEPQLEVRVAGVRWTPVADFAESAPDDRHYRIVTAADQTTSVVFGDGRTGAVPPAGATLEAAYRIGRGSGGNIEVGRLSRLKRAHPLLDHVSNQTPVSGGTEPSGPDDVRSQATRWIRTFDRAVSVADLADLALTMPGIARASARWDPVDGAVLVVATAEGDPPNPLSAVRAFLDARRDTGLRLTLTGPTPDDLDLAVDVDPDPAWLPEVVSAAVRTALTTRFAFPAEDLGAPGYLSEVYALLEGLPGVLSVRVGRFASLGNDGIADAVRPDPAGWLRLQPQNLAVTLSGRPS